MSARAGTTRHRLGTPEAERAPKLNVRVPSHVHRMLDQLVADGYAANRTEAVVDAISDAHVEHCVSRKRAIVEGK